MGTLHLKIIQFLINDKLKDFEKIWQALDFHVAERTESLLGGSGDGVDKGRAWGWLWVRGLVVLFIYIYINILQVMLHNDIMLLLRGKEAWHTTFCYLWIWCFTINTFKTNFPI